MFDDNIDLLSEVNIDGLSEEQIAGSSTQEGGTTNGETPNGSRHHEGPFGHWTKDPEPIPKNSSDNRDLMQLRTRLIELCLKKQGEFEEMAYICEGLINWTQRQTFLAALRDRNNVESLVDCLERIIDDPDPRVESQVRYQRTLGRLMTFENRRSRQTTESARRVTPCHLCEGFHTRSSTKCTEKDY